MGCATAYFLAASPDFSGSVVVVERDPTYETCSATRSLGGIRQQFTMPENIRMSVFGAEFARAAGELLSVDGERCDVTFREQGYLMMASEQGTGTLRQNLNLQRRFGAAVEFFEGDALAERFPWLNREDIGGAVFGYANEGWLDPNTLLSGFRRKARSLGVNFLKDEIMQLDRTANTVHGFRTAEHGTIAAGVTVLAAGASAGAMARTADVFLPVRPRKRYVYVFDCRSDLQHAPLTIDPGGATFQPESGQYLGTSHRRKRRIPTAIRSTSRSTMRRGTISSGPPWRTACRHSGA